MQENAEAYFNRIYNETVREIYQYTVVKTSAATEVEDIVQTVYQKFYQRIIKKGYADLIDSRAYLYKLAKSELSRFYGILRMQRESVPMFSPDTDGGYEDIEYLLSLETPELESLAEDSRLRNEIWDYVREMPLDAYKVFTLYFMFDVPIAGIAAKLNMTESNVKNRLYRTRQKVREKFMKGETYGREDVLQGNSL